MDYETIQTIFVFLFITIFFIKLIISKINNIKIIQIYSQRGSLKQFLYEIMPLILVTIIILVTLSNYFERGPVIPDIYNFNFHYYINNIGLLIGSISFVFLILGYQQLGLNWKIGSGRNFNSLVTSGIFSITRNPVYVFFIMFSFSIFLLNGSIIFLLLSILLALSFHRVILQEEKNLEKLFKENYINYKKRTPRYL
ncbi:MAG: methyltransferase [Candidatus Pacebacteria bacterium]|nr:methyltransferase [Candidatus Paceibacterota bacterium]MDD2757429.1 methyltransferase [Candidatus Paceibacterota bacterium]MDD3283805.1 methyltransferase [Candidatus Paceibacterota bacterium]MDD3970011.1 methyltransferase [Candidatus Paceibacterota bacterium]MDD4738077.1 methyltransferase [Candidatus Paceibacterota bacterium]